MSNKKKNNKMKGNYAFLHKLLYISLYRYLVSQNSTVGIATGYGLDGWGVGVQVPVGARFFSSPRRQDQFWGPSSFLSNGYGGLSTQK
jgi:hypothetical protein